MSDLTFCSATSIAAAIRRKDVSSREVVDAHLDHIQRVNPPLNAVVSVLAESDLCFARLGAATFTWATERMVGKP